MNDEKDTTEDRAMKRAEQVSRNYAMRASLGRGTLRKDGDIEAQAANYAESQARLCRLRADVALLLDGAGVPSIVRPFYYSFAQTVARRDRQLNSEFTRRAEARVQVDLWESRGLVRVLLLRVCREVLGLEISTPCAESGPGVKSVRE